METFPAISGKEIPDSVWQKFISLPGKSSLLSFQYHNMPRRPSKRQKGGRAKPRAFDRKDSKLDRWEKPSDIPLDEEDECE